MSRLGQFLAMSEVTSGSAKGKSGSGVRVKKCGGLCGRKCEGYCKRKRK